VAARFSSFIVFTFLIPHPNPPALGEGVYKKRRLCQLAVERLWKFVKKKCLWSKYYPNFQEFKTAISNCLNQTHTNYKDELAFLLALKFQSFKKAQIMTV